MPFSEEFTTHRRRGTSGTAGLSQGVGLGDVTFTVPGGHATVITYEARVRAEGSSTVLATKQIGRPDPNGLGQITFNMRAQLDALPVGNYTVTVAAINAAGTDDSDPLNALTYVVPLVQP